MHSTIATQPNTTYDGDTCSADFIYLQESLDEVRKYLKTRASLLTPAGVLSNPVNTDTIELVMRNLLTDME